MQASGGTAPYTWSGTSASLLAVLTLAPTTPSNLPAGTGGTAYSSTSQASGGTAPYHCSITSGRLPASLSLAASSGVFSGTPTATGTSSFTATVTDSGSPAQTKSVTTSI